MAKAKAKARTTKKKKANLTQLTGRRRITKVPPGTGVTKVTIGDIVKTPSGRKFVVIKTPTEEGLAECIQTLHDTEISLAAVERLTVVGRVDDVKKWIERAHQIRGLALQRDQRHRDRLRRSHSGRRNGPY